jgi:hypothetical protein
MLLPLALRGLVLRGASCAALVLVGQGLVGCSRDGSPAGGAAGGAVASASAPVRAAASVVAPASAVPAVPAAASSAPAAHPPVCEVEMSGLVKEIPKGKFANLIISDEDCLSPTARIVGRSGVSVEGKFFYEVYVKWGTDLTICSAVEPGVGKPSTLYGKAKGPFHAEASGEVEFKNVEIVLAPGPAHAVPTKLEPPPSRN